ncbi:MAG: addiction module protein [Mucilaginibacter sp.]
MDTAVIRQKLYEYIRSADDEKVKAIYTILESDESPSQQWWNDEELVAELDKRSSDLKSGADKGMSWEEVKSRLLKK